MILTDRLTLRLDDGRTTSFGATLEALAARVHLWHQRRRERRELAGLNDRELLDFGASRADVASEIRKPFWRD